MRKNKMDIKEELEQRMQRTMLMVKATTEKLIRKEFKKLKRDLIKGIWKSQKLKKNL